MLIIVTGGIAAYKICDVIGLARKHGHEVNVVMTKGATEFITPLTLATLSGNPICIDQFAERVDVEHIELAKWANVVLVAPATYNFIGKIANGIADDLASTVVAAVPCETKLFVAPAMNTNMWCNPVLKRNMKDLKSAHGRSIVFIPPRSARLACGDVGEGALARPQDIIKAVFSD